MKDINQYRYITHKNQNTMIRVIIENLKTGKSYICKSYGKTVTPIHDLLELTITETPLDGRTRYAKQLPVYNTDVLAELTY